MNKTVKQVLIFTLILMMSSCFPDGFKEQANQKFGDQHFKTAISLIELHKIREGEYPRILDSLQYIGDWDKIIFSSVKYERLDTGYKLDLTNGWMGKPEQLNYPDDFWNGLGIVESNLKK